MFSVNPGRIFSPTVTSSPGTVISNTSVKSTKLLSLINVSVIPDSAPTARITSSNFLSIVSSTVTPSLAASKASATFSHISLPYAVSTAATFNVFPSSALSFPPSSFDPQAATLNVITPASTRQSNFFIFIPLPPSYFKTEHSVLLV